jgi:hypothetical protein
VGENAIGKETRIGQEISMVSRECNSLPENYQTFQDEMGITEFNFPGDGPCLDVTKTKKGASKSEDRRSGDRRAR